MANRINNFVFTPQILSSEEVQQVNLKTNSHADSLPKEAGITVVADGQDSDGVVILEENSANKELDAKVNQIYKDGFTINNKNIETVNTPEDLKMALFQFGDRYKYTIENYQYKSWDDQTGIRQFINNESQKFYQNYIKKHPEGPYDLKEITRELIPVLDMAYKGRSSNIDNFDSTLDKIKANKENIDIVYATQNMNVENLSQEEYQNLKQEIIDYIMGNLASGNMDMYNIINNAGLSMNTHRGGANLSYNRLHQELQKSYGSNSNKMNYLEIAERSLSEALNDPKKLSEIVNNIIKTQQQKNQNILMQEINNMTETETGDATHKEEFKNNLLELMNEFLSKYEDNETDIVSDFKKFVQFRNLEESTMPWLKSIIQLFRFFEFFTAQEN